MPFPGHPPNAPKIPANNGPPVNPHLNSINQATNPRITEVDQNNHVQNLDDLAAASSKHVHSESTIKDKLLIRLGVAFPQLTKYFFIFVSLLIPCIFEIFVYV